MAQAPDQGGAPRRAPGLAERRSASSAPQANAGRGEGAVAMDRETQPNLTYHIESVAPSRRSSAPTCCAIHAGTPWAYSPTCPAPDTSDSITDAPPDSITVAPPANVTAGDLDAKRAALCADGRHYFDLAFRDDALTEVVATCEWCGRVRVYGFSSEGTKDAAFEQMEAALDRLEAVLERIERRS